jgi:hypothetical protein
MGVLYLAREGTHETTGWAYSHCSTRVHPSLGVFVEPLASCPSNDEIEEGKRQGLLYNTPFYVYGSLGVYHGSYVSYLYPFLRHIPSARVVRKSYAAGDDGKRPD